MPSADNREEKDQRTVGRSKAGDRGSNAPLHDRSDGCVQVVGSHLLGAAQLAQTSQEPPAS